MNSRRFATLACFIAFIVMGITTSILGPTLRDVAASLGIRLADAGLIQAAQQIGIIVATVGGGRFLDWRSPRDVLLPGALIMAVGLVGLVSGHVALGLIAAAVLGIGSGFVNLGANVAIGAMYAANASPVLAALHTFYGVGLFAGPLLAGWALTGDWRNAYLVTSALFVALGLLFATIRMPHSAGKAKDKTERPAIAIAWLPLLPLLMLLLMYNGAGGGISNWLATQLQLVGHTTEANAAQITALYGLALTTGRILSIGLLHRFGNMRVLTTAIASATLGSILMAFGGTQIGLVTVGVLMTGIGFAPIYPTVIAIGGQQQPENRGSVTGLLAGLASIGGMVIPVVQGWVGNGQSGGMIVTFVATLIMVFSLAWRQAQVTQTRLKQTSPPLMK